jgi:hypothetical protein
MLMLANKQRMFKEVKFSSRPFQSENFYPNLTLKVDPENVVFWPFSGSFQFFTAKP